MLTRGIIVGAPRSGSGKTTLTMALIAALRRRGHAVRAAKSGPDYIDPAFHAAASGAPVPNLDSWAMPPPLLARLAGDAARDADLVLVESAMGLFDGVAAPPGRSGAAADLAAGLRLPVLLLLDVSGQSQTAAVLGAMPRDPALALPERHLGLVQAGEHADLQALLTRLADMAERCLDLDGILAAAAPLQVPEAGMSHGLRPPGQRIALASDAAFSFIYAHVLAGWRAAGAEVVPFSPLADEAPRPDCDACWLPGGYPELHAGALAAAARFKAGLSGFAQTRPVHGECGGYMALGAGLVDAAGVRHAMAGLLGHSTSFAKRRMNLGYREATLLADGPVGRAGTSVRGHEFHYASVSDPGDDDPLAELRDAAGRALGPTGGRRGRVSGGFFHAIAPS